MELSPVLPLMQAGLMEPSEAQSPGLLHRVSVLRVSVLGRTMPLMQAGLMQPSEAQSPGLLHRASVLRVSVLGRTMPLMQPSEAMDRLMQPSDAHDAGVVLLHNQSRPPDLLFDPTKYQGLVQPHYTPSA